MPHPLTFALLGVIACAQVQAGAIQIERNSIETVPAFTEDRELSRDGIKALYYDGPSYQGKPSRVFAFYGCPPVKKGSKVPAVVLIHGGGGTAFPEWVQLWVDRGYAAIAMDLFGNVPKPDGRVPVEGGGPTCGPDFVHLNDPMPDQWPYYAENAIARARTLLGSFPEIDADKIGIQGISWGGFLSCIAAALDNRYAFAVHVYGCGYLNEHSAWSAELNEPGKEQWTEWFDPKHYLPATKTPTLWLIGTNDNAFSIESFIKSYQLLEKAPLTLAVRIGMPHGHPEGWSPREIEAFADSVVRGKLPLPSVGKPESLPGGRAKVDIVSKSPIQRADLVIGKKGAADWKERGWEGRPALLNQSGTRATAELPTDAQFYFFNIYDEAGLMTSSTIVEREEN